ncbi:MAG: 3-isopropylmalate dehydrogenase [Xanthomonadales bacterium]|nr:3-isopropylmalate dehydrogenase [Xanthomonadales bacterium]
MQARIVLLPGDGIGPDIVSSARQVLSRIAEIFSHQFDMPEHLVGGAAIDATGVPFPDETAAACRDCRGVLLGAVGGPKWDDPKAKVRPEQGLLQMRSAMGVFANLRPVHTLPALMAASPLKNEKLEGVDFLVVRELTGGIYFGEKSEGTEVASDLCTYTAEEVARIVHMAAKLAGDRRGKLTLVHKANVLATSRLWITVTQKILSEHYPALDYDTLLVDAAAMSLLTEPSRFDVIVTENMFGDILTDEAAAVAGSIGILPSASLSDAGPGLYEPIHGSAPDLAGTGRANPFGTLLSAAMLLDLSLGLKEEAQWLRETVEQCIDHGETTGDLGGPLGTEDATRAVLARLEHRSAA